jgi:hypothetical protein
LASNTLVVLIIYDLLFYLKKIPTLYPLWTRPKDDLSWLLVEHVFSLPRLQFRLPINSSLLDNCFLNFVNYYEKEIQLWKWHQRLKFRHIEGLCTRIMLVILK